MKEDAKVAVIGGGSWATALAHIVLQNRKNINWYIYEKEIIEHLQTHKHNPQYLSSLIFNPQQITFYNDIQQIIRDSDVILMVVPSAYIKTTMGKEDIDFSGKIFISAVKGIIPDENLTITQYFGKRYNIPDEKLLVVSGPSHAEEVAMQRLTYLTVGCSDTQLASKVSDIIRCSFVKTIISHDVTGIEYVAVLKNIYALATGIAHGLGYGDNFIAVLVANAVREMKRFLNKAYKGSTKRKIHHSVYLGDLLVTAYSQFSRNRTFGTMIGKGYSVKSTMLEMNMVAEGYYAVACIKEINKEYQINMPITDAVYNILYEKFSPSIEMRILTDKLQ
ncbi:MAG: NAD(P)H-dependent glycerol-3-phosphate dehydrogenase [Bacteroidetes bacterium]|nr:NAD(P)H-dependent glycerol-3-phosphate dehydrogenase [Bacteroidales bacterium]NJO68352.1 NAD(P)H-dependent glycerol-3-phosphate dehydrogenase [Bacteroidota bacterium]